MQHYSGGSCSRRNERSSGLGHSSSKVARRQKLSASTHGDASMPGDNRCGSMHVPVVKKFATKCNDNGPMMKPKRPSSVEDYTGPLHCPRRRLSCDESQESSEVSSFFADNHIVDDGDYSHGDDYSDDDATRVTSNTNPTRDDDDEATQVTSNTNPRSVTFDLGKEKDERHTVTTCPTSTEQTLTSNNSKHSSVGFGTKEKEDDVKHITCSDDDVDNLNVEEIAISQSRDVVFSEAAAVTEDTEAIPLLTEEKVRSFITDYYEDFDSIFQNGADKQVQRSCFEAFFDQYYTPDVLWVRSSGNPIGRKDLTGLLTDNIDVERAILVNIDHITILAGGLAAVVVYTADLQFSFQGKPQNDRTVLSSVMQLYGVEPKIAHVHWSVGQPIPKTSRWES